VRKKTPPTRKDDPATAFPAPPATPGQKASRDAYAILEEKRQQYGWWDGYLTLREEKWDWRKAAYIAWEACPPEARWPRTQLDLATMVLGLKDTSTIRHWKAKQPEIEKRVETLRVLMLERMAMGAEEVLYLLSQQARASMGDFIRVAPMQTLRLNALKKQKGEEGGVSDSADDAPQADLDPLGGGAWAFDFEAIKAKGHLIKGLKETQHGVSLAMVDSLGALKLLGQYHKLFTEKVESETKQIGMTLDEWREEQKKRQAQADETMALFDDDDDDA
jgi:hypothetical protein